MNILIIDDMADARALVRAYLAADEHVRVVEAPDAKTGLNYLAREAFDVVLLDIRMPDFEGLSLLDVMKKAPGPGKPRFVMVSAVSSESVVRDALDRGAHEYLQKPFSKQQLRDRLLAWQEAAKTG